MRKTIAVVLVTLAVSTIVSLHSSPTAAQPAGTQPVAGMMTDANARNAAALGAMVVPEPGKMIFMKGTSKLPVTFDGHVSKFEYGDAGGEGAAEVTFPNNHGQVEVFIKISDGYLYFAYQIPDLSPFMGDDIVTMLDLKNEKTAAPTANDTRAYVRRKMENSRTQEGDGTKWVDNYGPWEYRSALYANGWEVEARIPLKALNVEAGKKTTLGVAFRIWDNEPEKMSNWPAGSNEKKPETWGKLVIE